MTFEEKGNGTTIRLVETVYLYLIQIDFDSKVTEFFHNDLGLRNVGEFVWTESLGRSLGAMEGGVFGTPSADSWTLLKRSTQRSRWHEAWGNRKRGAKNWMQERFSAAAPRDLQPEAVVNAGIWRSNTWKR